MFWLLFLAMTTSDETRPIPASSRQLLLVLTADAKAKSGTLFRFERDSERSAWKRIQDDWPIVVGKTGLASGRGLNREPLPGLAPKTEGDGKSPAGVFALTETFGFDEAPKGVRMPYVRLGDGLECVDDPKSSHYNRLVDRNDVSAPDWSSSEKMHEIEEYRWGVVVAHNSDPIEGGKGSCIFLHAWSAPDGTTVGCTAMELARIEELVRWLRPESSPVLVQLTASVYRELKRSWALPDIDD